MTPAEREMMDTFRRDYLDLLDDRIAKIRQLLAVGDAEPARVALLSLESSSAMVGADLLAAVARRLRTLLGDGGSPEAPAPLLEDLEAEADAARAQVGSSPG